MKLIITENQYRILLSEQVTTTEGMEDLMDILLRKFPQIGDFKDTIETFISNSGCPKIEINGFKLPAAGLALHDKVVYNTTFINSNLPLGRMLYIIFHEMAHQYQYKKYGRDKMYELYNGVLPIDEAVQFLRYTENVADEFAIRKCRELYKLGLRDMGGIPKDGMYKFVPDIQLKSILVKFRNTIRNHNLEDNERISEILYNNIINILN